MTARSLFFVAATFSAAGGAVPMTNMNGNYSFANQKPGTKAVHRGDGFFDCYTPVVNSHYGEVMWNSLPMGIPQDIIDKFDGKMMNIVGYEFDIIRKDPKTGEEVSVPAWEQYNHHYNNNVMGKGTTLVKTRVPTISDDEAHTGHKGHAFVNTDASHGNLRTRAAPYSNQFLPMGNGAESRKTFHFFPPGYGAQVFSPNNAVVTPMIIDTMNRDGVPGTKSTRHGIVPPSSNVGPDAMYSGIMECPCTDKWPKHISSFSTLSSGKCTPEITDAQTCFASPANLGIGPVLTNTTVNDNSRPYGCSVQGVSDGFDVVFNQNTNATMQCGEKSLSPRVTAVAESLVDIVVDLNPAPIPPSTSIVVPLCPKDACYRKMACNKIRVHMYAQVCCMRVCLCCMLPEPTCCG